MSRLLASAFVAALACGCGKQPAEVLTPAPAPGKSGPVPEPQQAVTGFPDEVKLPEANGAKALDKSVEHAVYLNVNSKGQVVLAPLDQFKTAKGDTVTTLDNPAQVTTYLRRRAHEDGRGPPPPPTTNPAEKVIETTFEAADEPDDWDWTPAKPLRSVIVFRIDRQTPFEKAYPVWRAAQRAGFAKAQWRALRPGNGGEGQIAAIIPVRRLEVPAEDLLPWEKQPRLVVRVTADGAGKIEKVTLREDEHGIEAARPEIGQPPLPELGEPDPPKREPAPKPITDLGTDVDSLVKKLKALATKYKGKKLIVRFELDGKLLHTDVIRFIDAATAAGFADAELALIDKKDR